MVADRAGVRGDLARWIGHGAVGGILTGVLFIMFQLLIAAFQTGGEGFFLPLRAMSTLIVGPEALQPDFPLVRAGLTGIAASLALAAIGGMLLGLLVGLIPGVRNSEIGLMGAGGLYGLGVWFGVGLGLAPGGWVRYIQLSDSVIQLVAYALFLGAALGAYLAYVLPRRSHAPDWMLDARAYYARPRARRAA